MGIPKRSLSTSNRADSQLKQSTIESRIERFLDRKYRRSSSFRTVQTYRNSVLRFTAFVNEYLNMDCNQLIDRILGKQIDGLEVLDDFYTWLRKVRPESNNDARGNLQVPAKGYSAQTIKSSVVTAKEFLNDCGCRIYWEDIKQKFKLPKIPVILTEGLTKSIIAHILRLANYKLAAAVLIACSSGMRIGEIAQLKLSDIDFETRPTQINIRAETTKTRDARITHISSEATNALRDMLAKSPKKENEYIFLINPDSQPIKQNLKYNHETNLSSEELVDYKVKIATSNLMQQLASLADSIPELSKKSENGIREVHFHAFRYFFKTQVTDAHESDFAEALMGHKSVKLVYYRQNAKARIKTYQKIEHALTIGETEEIEKNLEALSDKYEEQSYTLEDLIKTVRNLEKRLENQ